MKLSYIKKHPIESLDYLERMVNNGSPSGFSEKNTVSDATNPFLSDRFSLCRLCGADSVKTYGEIPAEYVSTDSLLVHPDWQKCPSVNGIEIVDSNISVVPTSSGRTVRVKDGRHYIKLSYPGVIGRLLRELDERHLNSCIQVNQILLDLIGKSGMPNTFALMQERGGQIYYKGGFKTGCVYRDYLPTGLTVDRIKYTIPAFSLFGLDRQKIDDELLLLQLLVTKKNPSDFLINQIILPLIDIYFTCVFAEGLSPELHAQNVLLGLDDNDDVAAVIIRDLESVDKDITIRAELGKSPFCVLDYKAIKAKDYNYKIKHSFMYDHKLGEYLISEILNCAFSKRMKDKHGVISQIREYVRSKYGMKIKSFFPEDGHWYKFKAIEIDSSSGARPYICFENPILR